jgi:uncharacterized protein with von Willebrand factor type A (vWA) domain
VPVAPASSAQAIRALTFVRLEQARDFRSALECCLTSSAEERGLFEVVYEAFWSADGPGGPPQRASQEESGPGDTVSAGGQITVQIANPAGPERPDQRGLAGRAVYSRQRGKGGQVAAQPRREIDELARRLARALGTAPGRRVVSGDRGETVDLRGSLRDNLRFGEELLLLRRTTVRRDRPRIAVLCDVSSSMLPSTPLFLAFTHALTKLVRRVESAIFNVELAVVTEVFRRTTLPQALRWLDQQQGALSGGTRIGHCLHRFLDHLEHRSGPGTGTIALILSDGWDVGDAELLQDGMRRLRRQVGRIAWCDPNAAAAGYQPQVQGLRVALPYVDDYLDFATVTSLSRLVGRLEAGGAPRRLTTKGRP